MNDESPIRISSMLLTVGCIICGISAAVLMLPKYLERPRSVNHATAAGTLQLNLAEFHANQPNAAPEQDQPLPPTRRSLVPVSSAIPLKKHVGSGVASPMQSQSHHFGGLGSAQTASSNLIESTVVDRHAQSSTSPVGSGPIFYAPVTVHPVTVNIDNSGIIREITRVNERLDSLTAEKSRFEKDVMARIEGDNSTSSKTAASVTAVEFRSPAPRHEVVLQDRVHSIADTTSTSTTSTRVKTNVQSRMAVTEVSSAVEKSRKDAPQRTVERLKTAAKPPVVFTRDVLPAPRIKPVAVPAPVEVPPVKFHQDDQVPPMPEIKFDARPTTPVPDVPAFEPPAFELPPAESEINDSQSVPEFEFSTELSVPSPVAVTPEIASFIEFEAEPFTAAEPVPVSEFKPAAEPEFETVIATTNATTDVKTVTAQTAEIPVLPNLTAPGLQWAKRTTDPPFRRGVIASRATPRAAITNKAASKIQPVSHTVDAIKRPEPPSIPACHECGKPLQRSAHKNKAAAPPSPIQRLRSLFN